MLPEYLRYWGLSKPPFSLTPDPAMLYMSGQHQEGLLRLKYAVVSNKGGALLVSENAGDGKTSLLARLRQELQDYYEGHCRTVFIDHPTLTANQMVGEIARQLGVRSNTTDKLTLLNELREHLLQCHREGVKCVVILDEGQMLCHRPDILQELRILLNFCVSDSFLLTFILSGQKPLDEAIRAMPEFYQRLPVRFFLRNLGKEDTRELIRYRLRQAGVAEEKEIFSDDGYTGVFNYSKGCPRVICSVADLSLIIAHSRWSRQVDFVSVSQACSDMNRTEGGYHYFYFLKSFSESAEAKAPGHAPAITGNEAGQPVVEINPAEAPESRFADGSTKTAPPDMPAALETETPEAEEPKHDAASEPEIGQSNSLRMRFEIVEPAPVMPVDENMTVQLEPASPPEPVVQSPVVQRPEGIKCSFCGLELEPGAILCPNCGEELVSGKKPEPDLVRPSGVRPVNAGTGPEVPVNDVQDTGPADEVVCRSCGRTAIPVAAGACPACGATLDDDPAELELVRGIERCGFKRLVASRRYLECGAAPDPLSDELVLLAPGRFWRHAAVAQFANGSGGIGFIGRCGLSVRGTGIVIMLRGEDERIAYSDLRGVTVEPLVHKGRDLLHRVVLVTAGGRWLLTLPFKGTAGRDLAEHLKRYISIRSAVTVVPDFSGLGRGSQQRSGQTP